MPRFIYDIIPPKYHESAKKFWQQNSGRIKIATLLTFVLSFVAVAVFTFVAKPGVKNASAADPQAGDGILFYAATGNTTPQFRNYNGSTNDFSANAGTVAGAQPAITKIVTSSDKQEAIAGYQDTSGVLHILCYDGTTWTEDWSVTVAPSGTPTTQRFDIVYEGAMQPSENMGKVVVAYSRNTAAVNALAYRTKLGTANCGSANWSNASNFPTTTTATSGTVLWVKGSTDSYGGRATIGDQSVWVWLDNAATNADLGAAIYANGSFTNFVQVETSMEHIAAVGDTDNFDVKMYFNGDVFCNGCVGQFGRSKWHQRCAI